MSTLPGWALDLLTDGANLSDGGRAAVAMAVRKVMLAAHRQGLTFPEVYPLLTDTHQRRLAAQVATGKGGRKINRNQRDKFLRDQWDDTAKVVAQRPAWNKEQAVAAVAHVREAFDADEDLLGRDRAIIDAVLTIAEEVGTTRVAAPAHTVATMTGGTTATTHRALMRIAAEGKWLSLAKHGNAVNRRANLYSLAPALLNIWGASPPISHTPPISHPPISHSDPATEGALDMSVALTASSPEALAEAIRLLAAAHPEQVRRALEDAQAEVPRLRVVGEAGT